MKELLCHVSTACRPEWWGAHALSGQASPAVGHPSGSTPHFRSRQAPPPSPPLPPTPPPVLHERQRHRDIKAPSPGGAEVPGFPRCHSHLMIALVGEQPHIRGGGPPRVLLGGCFLLLLDAMLTPSLSPWFRDHLPEVWPSAQSVPSPSDCFKDRHVAQTRSVRPPLFGTSAGPLLARGLELLAAT